MFDSPFEYCTVCKEYVLLDQTHRQCALEHRCCDVAACPLRKLFTGIEFRNGKVADAPGGRRKRSPAG